MANLLDGRAIAEKIKEDIKRQIKLLGIKPVLVSIQVGNNPVSEVYVKSQQKTAESLGVEYRLEKLEETISEDDLAEYLQKFNGDKSVNGIIIQIPLPQQIDYKKISRFILPEKDVEGMHPVNIGKLLFGKTKITPCTPAAVMELLKDTGLALYGKEVVIVGHSEIVGKPLALLLLERFATVTICHIGTSQAGKLEEHVRKAEILIVAVGKAGLIKGDWIKDGAVVIDVGINKVDGKIVGDVEFEGANLHAFFLTPVPGGVGPLTVTMLMRNLIEAAKIQQEKK